MNVEQLKSLLKTSIVRIEFLKHNGSKRVMLATLNDEYLPSKEGDGGIQRAQNNQVVSVWDTEQNGWRSFRFDSLIGEPEVVRTIPKTQPISQRRKVADEAPEKEVK